jgi:hypothetical protein
MDDRYHTCLIRLILRDIPLLSSNSNYINKLTQVETNMPAFEQLIKESFDASVIVSKSCQRREIEETHSSYSILFDVQVSVISKST